jgi:hypothetical protein
LLAGRAHEPERARRAGEVEMVEHVLGLGLVLSLTVMALRRGMMITLKRVPLNGVRTRRPDHNSRVTLFYAASARNAGDG